MSEYIIQIKSGLHAGVTRNLSEGNYVLGSRAPADIILMDEGLSATNAALNFLGARLKVEALAEDVIVDGKPLESGKSIIVKLPVSLSIAGIDINCSLSGSLPATENIADNASAVLAKVVSVSKSPDKRIRLGIIALGLACLFLVAAPIFKAVFPYWLSGKSISAGNTKLPTSILPPVIQTVDPTTYDLKNKLSKKRVNEPVRSQELFLAAEKLNLDLSSIPTLRAVATSDAIRIEGSIAPADLSKWQDIAQKFDTQHNGRILLVRQFEEKLIKQEALPKIEAVWAGNEPYIIIGGRRFFAGSRLEKGWIVESINNTQITLERTGQKSVIRVDKD